MEGSRCSAAPVQGTNTQGLKCMSPLRWGTIYSVALQTDGITELLMAPAKLKYRFPQISGTRALSDNLSDLKAQVAANNKGIALVGDLIKEYTLPVVQAYMYFIQVRASLTLRAKLFEESGFHSDSHSA